MEMTSSSGSEKIIESPSGWLFESGFEPELVKPKTGVAVIAAPELRTRGLSSTWCPDPRAVARPMRIVLWPASPAIRIERIVPSRNSF